MSQRHLLIGLVTWVFSCQNTLAANTAHQVIKQLRLPKGFSISVYADNVPNARSLALGDNGVVYVGTRQEGSVYAVQDTNGDGVADKKFAIGLNLNMPNGVAYKNGSLYVAEINRILRYDYIGEHLYDPPKPQTIYDQLPADKHHGWKYLRFGPDNKLYTAVGAPCNICEPSQAIYGSLVRLDPDGSHFEILAQGIRNTVGFDWQPGSGDLYFTENGRDYLGDDRPPDELNRWTKTGQHFGYPYCHGGSIPDPELAGTKTCEQFEAPAWKFKAHMAPLGVKFYTGTQFPPAYRNQLFVAQHGSWNRTQAHGYRLALLKFDKDQVLAEEVFVDGWLTHSGQVLGRPVDILQMPDGSLLVSDDMLGVIYRIVFAG